MYLCNSKGSACALPFLVSKAPNSPPNPKKGLLGSGWLCKRATLGMSFGPNELPSVALFALSFGPNENKTVLLQMIRNGFSRI